MKKKTNNFFQAKIEKSKKIIKYILMGFIVLVSVRYIPKEYIKTKEIVIISFIAAISFAILDMVAPSISFN